MRPLDKGKCPTDKAGIPILVNDYDLWRSALIESIGYYCAYCNMPLSHSLQVEHVIPKNPPAGYAPGDPLAWENMLLACGPCNNSKSNKPINLNNFYFPEETNTLLPFEIAVHPTNALAAIVKVRAGLTPKQEKRAKNTIELLALANIDNRRDIVDIRWQKRKDAILAAEALHSLYISNKITIGFNMLEAAQNVALIVKSIGFFGIWFDKFADEPEVIEALINPAIIPGTARNCFNTPHTFEPVPRNPGNALDPI